jgi:hypothetical protein
MSTIIKLIATMLAPVLAGHYAQSIQAAEFDGMLLQSCLEQRDEGSVRNSVCLGYLRGLVAGLKEGARLKRKLAAIARRMRALGSNKRA